MSKRLGWAAGYNEVFKPGFIFSRLRPLPPPLPPAILLILPLPPMSSNKRRRCEVCGDYFSRSNFARHVSRNHGQYLSLGLRPPDQFRTPSLQPAVEPFQNALGVHLQSMAQGISIRLLYGQILGLIPHRYFRLKMFGHPSLPGQLRSTRLLMCLTRVSQSIRPVT
jgi:hypothetical protein